MILFLRFRVAVLAVELALWKSPVVPKFAPVEVALMKTVL